MAALRSIRPAVGAIASNPILVAITALFGLSQLPNLLVQPTRPLLVAAVSLVSTGVLILVFPFFQGGLLAMASEALRGKTSLGTLRAEGTANYVPLLLAYLVLLAINVGFAFLVVVGVIVGVVGVSLGGVGGGATAGGDWTLLAVIGVIVGGTTLVYLLVTLFVQFYGHAIVLDDRGSIDGFRRSVAVVRSNLLAVLGYSVVLGVGGTLIGTMAAVGGILSAAWGTANPELPASPLADLVVATEPTTTMIAGFAAVYVVVSGVFGAFYATYSVAFYESIRPANLAVAEDEVADHDSDDGGNDGDDSDDGGNDGDDSVGSGSRLPPESR